ncbi:MAG TPA: glycerophosphodiester phosphodiesterase family protein, partial [Bacteroidota bacterium]|nr:glycerophosphodiester phosphodiesterase family protein [Bacteroidota bacterium]
MISKFIEYLENKSPLIIYHRGYSSIAPENTISAFDLVLNNGGIAIEFDVRLSKDKELILIHDATIDRTSSGSGKVSNMTYDELKKNDFGSWFSEKFRNEEIPLLSFVFDRYKDKFLYDIELKPEDSIKNKKILSEKVLYEIRKYNLEKNVLLSSF